MSRVRHSTGRRRKKHEEHANHEAWAIPYADLLTLLLAFFVVMYAISSVNAGKYRVLSDSLFAAFRGAPRSMQPVQVGEKQMGTGADMNATVVQQAVLDGKAQSRLAPIPVAVGLQKGTGDSPIANKLPPQAAAAAAALSRLADEVALAMNQLVKKDMVTIRRSDFWIEVEMKTDILFPSGSARLADNAVNIIEQLGAVLAPFPNPIRVEGHTDNKPIKTAVFYSNWELSAARAGSVVRVLANHGVGPDRLAVIGYGEQRPLKGNDTEDGRNANRRVVVVILSTEVMRQTDPPKAAESDSGSGSGPTAPAAPAAPSVSAASAASAASGASGAAAVSGASAASAASGAAAVSGTSGAPAVSATSHASGAPVSNESAAPGGSAIASPADSPQALPAGIPPPPVTQPAAQTARTDIQHNTGTEPAP